jgi:ABC-type lipopolysaccharide export system ATPase subunit
MIAVENLTKKYAGVTAVDGLSFTVNRGEICGFLGPNGGQEHDDAHPVGFHAGDERQGQRGRL